MMRDDVSLQICDLNRSQQQIEARLQCAASDLCARAAELRQVEQKQAADLEATGRQLSEIRLRVDGLGEKNREVQELKDLEFKAAQRDPPSGGWLGREKSRSAGVER